MHRQKRIIRTTVTILLLLLGIAGYIFFTNVSYFKEGSERVKSVARNDIQFRGWKITSAGYITQDDPQIILGGITGYVDRLELLMDTADTLNPQVFYLSDRGTFFSEGNSFVPEYQYNNGVLRLSIQREVQGLRVDLTNEPGVTIKLHGVQYARIGFALEPVNLICFIFLLGLLLLPIYFSRQTFVNIKMHVGGIKRYSYLLMHLVQRDIIVKYRRSVLGMLWSVLNPLLMMMVITAVFQRLFRFQVENFPMYYLTGSLMFGFVSEATSGAMVSIINSAALLRKVYIPKYIFVLEKCIFSFVNMLFSFVAVLIMLVVLGMQVHWTIILCFIPMLYAFLFSLGLGLILATMEVFLRDTAHIYSVFITLWMYLTPVIYPADILPQAVRAVVELNPLYYYVEYFRSLVMYGIVPGWNENAICIVFSLLLLGLGLFAFKKKQDSFIQYL